MDSPPAHSKQTSTPPSAGELHDPCDHVVLSTVDHHVGTESAGEIERTGDAVDDEDVRAAQFRQLQLAQPDRARADDRDLLIDANVRTMMRVQTYREGVDQCRFLEADMIGKFVELLLRATDEFAVRARHVFCPHVVEMFADVVALDGAVFANAIAHHRFDDDPVAGLEIRDIGADLHHFAGEFVPDDVAFEVRLGLVPVPEICAADASDAHAG
jgi:hypothetical protein